MDARPLAERIDDLSPLADPVRRQLYLLVSASASPVGRDEAAARAGISRALAAFHLDRLVDAGLLATEFRRLSGRTGPGAGRPAKLYARADREISISLPERRYQLLADLLVRAVDAAGPAGAAVEDALGDAARSLGQALGADARRRAGADASRERLMAVAADVLAETGFEPHRQGENLLLRNCPFDAVARDHQALVCWMNASLMDGVLLGLRVEGIEVDLDPAPGRCCVVWRPAKAVPLG